MRGTPDKIIKKSSSCALDKRFNFSYIVENIKSNIICKGYLL